MPRRTAALSEAPSHIPYLDGLRGYSILCVVIGHAGAASRIPPLPAELGLLIGNADLGVRTFFVISGYLITALSFANRTRLVRSHFRGSDGASRRRTLRGAGIFEPNLSSMRGSPRPPRRPARRRVSSGADTWLERSSWRSPAMSDRGSPSTASASVRA